MATLAGGLGIPGVGAAIEETPREILWEDHPSQVLRKSVIVDGATRDAGNTPTTVLRAGLLLGKLTADDNYTEWDADATDGSQDLIGPLSRELRAQDFDGTDADRVLELIIKGPVKASQLLIQGSALVGHVDEYLARRMLHGAGFTLDDDPAGYLAGNGPRFDALETATTKTLTDADTGKILYFSNVASVTVTLPATCKPGQEFFLLRTGAEEFILNGAANIITGQTADAGVANVVVQDTVTYTTADEHLGAYFHVLGVYHSTTPKWWVRTNNALTRAYST